MTVTEPDNAIGPGYRAGRRILDVASAHPQRTALVIDGDSWTYAELLSAAAAIAAGFPAADPGEPQPVTAVMAERHVSSYAGILAARLSGHAYVPLNVNHPSQRNAGILERSGAGRIVCGNLARDTLREILESGSAGVAGLPIIEARDSRAGLPQAAAAIPEFVAGRPQSLAELAYILFTSGSTGEPKGVPIRNGELESYLAAAGPMVEVRAGDRFSQTFDLTFDLSVHDLFLCWENGATLVVPSEKELRMPAGYIRAHGITCWFSVPSLAYQVRLQEDLAPGVFPSLRLSLFCGEALPAVVAKEWAAAAPNSRVENWYGPTEATIACSRFEFDGSPVASDTVPIGKAFPGMELLVLDEAYRPCPAGTPGELYLSGRQLASGYLNDPAKTAASFIALPGSGKRVYRTGDRAVLDEQGNAHFLGRVDNQVKVRGYRIELGEIEAALREAADGRNAVALAWPAGTEIATSVIAALECESADTAAILAGVAARLPDYMVPALLACVPEFPKNASGKVDRRALGELLAASAREHDTDDDPALSKEAHALLASIRTHAPLLDRRNVLTARNLFDAGMDSLSFISVTTDIERQFGLILDQDTVVMLAEMSFDEIVREIRGETNTLRKAGTDAESLSVVDRLKKLFGIRRVIHKPRANRALQFIERFPGYLAARGAPDVLAVGSSCVFRAFYPPEFTSRAAQHGKSVTALNAGFPAVTLSGLAMLCEFIRGQCRAAGARIPLIIYEFDVMLASTRPPSGDINLGPDYFSGNVISLRGGRTNPEFEWLQETAGAWNAPEEARQKSRKPNWARARDEEIARAYLGEIDFDPKTVADWLRGGRALAEIADRLVVFVHPADREMTDEIGRGDGPDRLADVVADAASRLGVDVLPWHDFRLGPECYLDINHMNARGGREELSRQLADMLFAGDGRG